MRDYLSMHRSPSRDKTVVWTAVGLVSIGAIVAGWFGLIWPYYVALVAAIYGFEVWYFRESLAGVRVTRGWIAPAVVYALILIGVLILWWFAAPWYAWVIYAAAASVTWGRRNWKSSRSRLG